MGTDMGRGFIGPEGDELINQGDDVIRALALRGAKDYDEGPIALRPSVVGVENAGRVYYATDTGDYWRHTGTQWRWQNSSAWYRVVGGAASDNGAGQVLKLAGAAYPSVFGGAGADIMSLVAKDDGSAVQCGPTGLYDVALRVKQSTTGTATQMTVWLNATGNSKFAVAEGPRTEGLFPFPLHGRVRLTTANSQIWAEVAAGGQRMQVQEMIIERVGP